MLVPADIIALPPFALTCNTSFANNPERLVIACSSSRGPLAGLDTQCFLDESRITDGCMLPCACMAVLKPDLCALACPGGAEPTLIVPIPDSGSGVVVISVRDGRDGAGGRVRVEFDDGAVTSGKDGGCSLRHAPDVCCPLAVSPPTIEEQPEDVRATPGGMATFTVVASGEGLTYEWFGPGGVALSDSAGEIEGATAATLRILNVQPDDGGDYRVRISNGGGSVDSERVVLVVGK